MAKQVTGSGEYTDPIQPDLGPDRLLFIVMCDDGSMYQFQKMEDAPVWNLRGRGDRDTPEREWSNSRAPLPADVEDRLDEALGKKSWTQ